MACQIPYLELHSQHFRHSSVFTADFTNGESSRPNLVLFRIKIIFASYGSKAQNMTYTISLLGYKYFVHFSGRRLFAYDTETTELRSVMK